MTSHRAILLSTFLLAAALAPRVAHAQLPTAEVEADAIFREATDAFAKRDFRAAAEKFEEAHRRLPRGATMYNAAIAWESAGVPERAADAFLVAVQARDLDPSQGAKAQRRVAELEKIVGRLEVRGPDGTTISIAHVSGRPIPTTVHLQPGTYELRFDAGPSGRGAATRIVTIAKGSPTLIDVAEGPTVAPAPSGSARAEPSPVHVPEPSRRSWLLPAAVVSGSVSVLATGAGAAFGLMGLDARDDYERSGFTDPDARDRAITMRTAANVAWATAATTAVIALVMFIVEPPGFARRSAKGSSRY